MEKVNDWQQVETYLQEGRVLCFMSNGMMSRFLMRNDKLHVYSDAAHYVLPWKDFQELYQEEVFYLYENETENVEISKEKDDEYYGWYHK